jgi:acetylornithine deacetylase/succinyl-diaminopimelate desuccinylase-like protein
MTYRYMLSAAGHDAGPIQSKYPAGMIFVPSVSGITHNEAELTHPRDLTNGAKVLANVLWSLSME